MELEDLIKDSELGVPGPDLNPCLDDSEAYLLMPSE